MPDTTLRGYGSVLYARRWMLALTVASAVAVAIALSLLLPDVYEARSEFYVVSESAALTTAASGRAVAFVAPLVVQETERWHLGILESQVVRRLVAQTVKGKDAAALRRDVDIEFSRKHIARVRARDRDPKRAAEIANAYPQALTTFLTQTGDARRRQTMSAIEDSLREVDVQLAATYKRLRTLLAEKRSPSVTAEVTFLAERKGALEREIATAMAQLEGIEKRIALTTEHLGAEAQRSSGVQGTLFISSIQRLRSEITGLEAELAAAQAEFDGRQGDQHPRVRTLSAKLAQQQQALQRELNSIGRAEVREVNSSYEQLRRELAALYNDRAAVRAEAAAKAAALEKIAGRADAMQDHALREQEIRVEIGRLERGRDALRLKQQDTLIQVAAEASPVVVVQWAEAPSEPKFPLILFNALVAAALGLIAGIYLALAYDYAARPRV